MCIRDRYQRRVHGACDVVEGGLDDRLVAPPVVDGFSDDFAEGGFEGFPGGAVEVSGAFDFVCGVALDVGAGEAGDGSLGEDAEMFGAHFLVHLDGGGDHVDVGEGAVSYTHLRAHETRHDLVCRLLLEKKKRTREDRV
eukprot:TRINITY_DN36718_c0_g1_i1.p4 TRINITY_DN36718_c0_g1~~TRINITY_DN36718_c0_g1_i1.p4  ORF type:complete len:139 (+),score=21.42 TRINITY_DN36718_c0_g1_i1:138-554(+)